MMKNYIFIFISVFVYTFSYGQCMSVDISINRQCTDGHGVITILTGDPDSVTYSIDGGATFTNNPTFQNQNVGTYNIEVQDTTGCHLSFTETIEPFLQVGPIAITTSCANNTGEIVMQGILGKPLYQYSFDGGQSFYTDSSHSEIGAGTYNVVIKDSYGCEIDTAVTVDAYPTISPTITPTNEQCNGSGPGSVDITFSDGASYDFSLDNGAPTTGTAYNNANLSAGFYVMDITDQNGCTSPFQFQIGADLVDDSVNINHEHCHYGDGDMEVFGFLGVAPYEYSIDNGTTYLPTGTFNNLSEGNHIVLIKDATGCVKTDSIYVTNFGGVVTTPSADDTVCLGNSAIVSVSHNAGVNANYDWDNGLSNLQSHTVTPTSTTTYTVIVSDDYGCKDTSETTIYVEITPSVSLSDNQLQACVGDSIYITAYGATNYIWSTGDTTDVMHYVAVGNETVTVTGYNGQCSDNQQMVIVIKPSPTAVSSANTYSVNTGDSIFFYSTGSITSTTTWNFGDGFSSQESNPYHNFNFPGAYNVILTTEMGGCEATDSLLVYVGTVSISELESQNVLIYPNPASDFINIKTKQKGELQLMDVKGQLIKQQLLLEGQNKIDISTIPKGVYIGKIKTELTYHEIKIVVE